ncbi:MAG: hypothetical protein QOE37_1410 [Microbacteriaceae bacterium]|jgi:protein-S-isoprenylcysteine O-methyltransferase|nr:hypothetical protein [Microbacteriaceae bacterium]
MAPYFTQHPIGALLFAVTVAAWVLPELWVRFRPAPDRVDRDRGTLWVFSGCLAAAWLVTAAASRLPLGAIAGQPIPFVIGLVVAWAGLVLRWSAFRALGRHFTVRVTTAADQHVVTAGPYRALRHPGYTGLELFLVGAALQFGNWIGVAAMLVLPMVGLVVRITVEERALEEALGEQYREFEATRKRMIPYVW